MRMKAILLTATILVGCIGASAAAQDSFLDVGEQVPITILINSSPWFGGFEAVVDLYVEQTGNKVRLRVTPFKDMLEKARSAVRDPESPYDLINLDTQWTIEFYEGRFLTPLTEIDPEFALPEEAFTYGDSVYWNAEKRWRTSDGGELMAISPNGNIHLLYYRGDLFEEAGLSAPATWTDVRATCEQLQSQTGLYGYLMRGEPGNPIRFDWMPFMRGYGASVVRDPENGDYTVTINSPEAKQALDIYLDIAKTCGPPDMGSIGQSDVIQLLSYGGAVQGHAVTAAWSSFEDPDSAVAGKLQAAVLPHAEGRDPGVVIGNWHLGVPQNLPDEHKQAALAFAKWFLTEGAQRAYAEAGSIPVRSDIFESDLAERPENRWMKAYLDSMPYAQQVLGFAEAAAVEEALGLRLNQALIGEMSSAAALNAAAADIAEIFEQSGRNTGKLPPLQD